MEHHGVLVMAVLGADGAAVWSHTLGLTKLGLPELIVTGARDPEAAEALLGSLARDLQKPHGSATPVPRAGAVLSSCGGDEAQLVSVQTLMPHLVMAVEIFGPSVRALQLVLADEYGCWPWDLGYRGEHQPLLGLPATPGRGAPSGP
ncbi:MAG TPA: DUF4262 domain-containing protein [Motilibacteraceae bacterium]|nr:DUF4262 domain-containing protein [Motilibacteraceae bacterium]